MLVRATVLAVWVAMLDFWLARHFHAGAGIAELSVLVGVPLGSLWCVGVIDFLIGQEERKSAANTIKTYFRDFIKTHLSPRVLILLFLVSGAFAATFSTVSISPIAGGGDREILLTPVTGRSVGVVETMVAGQAKNLHLWINPISAQYKLSVTGYLPKVVSVKPFFGIIVVPDRDLVQIPTLLFRPSFGSYEALLHDGRFKLYRKADNGFEELADTTGTHAWHLGPRRNQPGELRNEWQLETRALGLNEQSTAILMQRWRNPKTVEFDDIDMGPGQVICAVVTNVDGVPIAGVVGSIFREEYIDLPLGDFKDDAFNSSNTGSAACAWLYGGAN